MHFQIDKTDYEAMTLDERIRRLEVEGYVAIPNMLSPQQVDQLRAELRQLQSHASDATPLKQVYNDIQWADGVLTDLIAHAPMLAFLKKLFGEDVMMMTCDYSRSGLGAPAMSMPHGHTGGGKHRNECAGSAPGKDIGRVADCIKDGWPYCGRRLRRRTW